MHHANLSLDLKTDMQSAITHPMCRISPYEVAIGDWVAASHEENTKHWC